MQRTVNAIVLAAALATPWLAHAQQATPATNYVKLSAGQSDASIDFWGDDTDTVASLAVGAQVSNNIDVEFGYSHFGKAKYADVGAVGNTLTARSEAFYLAAVGKYAVHPAFSIFGKLGAAYHWSNRRGVRDGTAFNTDDDRVGPLIGLGVSWQFTPNWAADVDYTYFNRTSKVAGEASDIGVWTLGLKYLW
jgi:opacity protein-like surface antigen